LIKVDAHTYEPADPSTWHMEPLKPPPVPGPWQWTVKVPKKSPPKDQHALLEPNWHQPTREELAETKAQEERVADEAGRHQDWEVRVDVAMAVRHQPPFHAPLPTYSEAALRAVDAYATNPVPPTNRSNIGALSAYLGKHRTGRPLLWLRAMFKWVTVSIQYRYLPACPAYLPA
jgi:hypothetical protein